MEAKIVLGDNLTVSIASEFIENDGEDAERQKKMSAEEIKQNCETKAFQRLAVKPEKRLPICIMVTVCSKLKRCFKYVMIMSGNI